jgi:predicted nucleotide-binding protein
MNSLSLVRGIKQINILHTSSRERPAGISSQTIRRQSKDVFIIYGRDETNASKLKNILKRKWHLNGIILKNEPGSGKTIIEKFEREAMKAVYAFAILTPDDTIKYLSHKYRQPRPNVFFELGWFHGHIGREKVCILFREGGRIHSDLEGISLVKFKRDILEKIPDIEQELNSAHII